MTLDQRHTPEPGEAGGWTRHREPRAQSVFRLFSWTVLSSLARQVAFLSVNVVLFERLSRPIYGAIALGFAYRGVFAGLGEFGIRQIGWRNIARQPDRVRELTPTCLSAKSVTAAAAMILYGGLMPLLWEPSLPKTIFWLFGLAIVCNGGTFDFPLFGLSRMDLVARYSVAAYTVYLLGCLVLVTDDTRAWLVPALFVASMGLVIALEVRWFGAEHGRFQLRFRWQEMSPLFRQAWPIGAAETIQRLATAYPVILLGITASSDRVGDYRLGELGFSFLSHFGHLFGTACFSYVSFVFHHRRPRLGALLGQLFGWVALGALASGAGLFFLGPSALTIIFGDLAAPETLKVVRILGIALVLAVPVRFLSTLLAGIDRQQMLLAANTIAVVLGVGGGWIASSELGIVGMAVAVLMTEGIRACFLLMVYWKALRTRLPATASA